MLGDTNEVPVPNEVPPLGTSYQFIVPAEAVAPSVTVPVSQRDDGDVEVMVGTVFTVAIISVLVTVGQFPLVASTK